MREYYDCEPGDFDSRSRCRRCEDREDDIHYAGQFLEKLVKQLYSTEEFNKHQFEADLDELCGYLKVDMRRTDLMIERFHEVQYV